MVNWLTLDSEHAFETALQRSHEQPIVIFKHSTRCPVSSMALRMFERDWDLPSGSIEPYFLDLIRYRDVSGRIASELAVDHESPQLILVVNRRAVYDASHNMISVEQLKNHL